METQTRNLPRYFYFILLITELLLCILHTCVALINSHKELQRKLSFLRPCVYNHGLGIAEKKLFIGNNSSRKVGIMAVFVSDVDLRLYTGFATCQILHVRLKGIKGIKGLLP